MEKKAVRVAYGEALVKLGEKNDKVVVLDADLADGGDLGADFALRRERARQVGERGRPAVALDERGDARRVDVAAAARAVGDGDERGTLLGEPRDGAPDGREGRVLLRRKHLEGDRGRA